MVWQGSRLSPLGYAGAHRLDTRGYQPTAGTDELVSVYMQPEYYERRSLEEREIHVKITQYL